MAGLAALVRRYYVPALRAAYGITRDHHLAEDVVQEAFVRAGERIGQFDPARPFGPWFLRSVVNAAITAARRATTTTSWEALGDRPAAIDPGLGPEALVVGAETRAELWAALGRLAPEQRAASGSRARSSAIPACSRTSRAASWARSSAWSDSTPA